VRISGVLSFCTARMTRASITTHTYSGLVSVPEREREPPNAKAAPPCATKLLAGDRPTTSDEGGSDAAPSMRGADGDRKTGTGTGTGGARVRALFGSDTWGFGCPLHLRGSNAPLATVFPTRNGIATFCALQIDRSIAYLCDSSPDSSSMLLICSGSLVVVGGIRVLSCPRRR
jgi:hypothetical protein